MGYIDKMDSVFDSSSDAELDFDVMFDEDDHLVDLVEGFTEDGKPLTGDEFEDIHLSDDENGDLDSTKDLDDNTNPDDIRAALSDRDEKMGASEDQIEDGKEQKIGDNTKDVDINDKIGADQKFFNGSDEDYQKNDFSKGEIDPENINDTLKAQQEAADYLEKESEDDSMKATTDITDEKTSDDLDIEDEDDAESRKDNTVEGDGVGELDEAMSFLESDDESQEDAGSTDNKPADASTIEAGGKPDFSALGECDTTFDDTLSDNTFSDNTFSKDTFVDDSDTEKAMEEAMSFLEENEGSEGMLADNDEAKVHDDVQCDGSADCKCKMCQSKKEVPEFELAVGDTFKEAADPDVEAEVDDEFDPTDVDPDEAENDGLTYDFSDEDIIDAALNGDDE